MGEIRDRILDAQWCTCRRGAAEDCRCPIANHNHGSKTQSFIGLTVQDLVVGQGYIAAPPWALQQIFKKDMTWVCDWIIPEHLQKVMKCVALGHYVSTQGVIAAPRKLLAEEVKKIQPAKIPQPKRSGTAWAWIDSKGTLWAHEHSSDSTCFQIRWREV